MSISAKPIAAAMGKGRDDKCEGCGSRFICLADRLSLEHCRSCVRSTVAGHSNTDVMSPVTWLWCH